jgi:hypothetical protein
LLIRASNQPSSNIYKTLKQMGKVSLAWVVRDAAEEYINALEKRWERA